MERIFIPETVFTHQVLPFERLIQGLAESMQPSQGEPDVSPYRRQLDNSAYRRQFDDSAFGRHWDDSAYRRQLDDSAYRRQLDDSAYRRQWDDSAFRQQRYDSAFRQQWNDSAHRRQSGDSAYRAQWDDSAHRRQNPTSCCRRQGCDSACGQQRDVMKRGKSPNTQLGSDVSVKVENGTVVLHARREDRHGDDIDISETRRTVRLPPGVDQGKVHCFFRPDGRVIIRAPFAEKKTAVPQQQLNAASKKATKSTEKDTKSQEANDSKASAQSEGSSINRVYDKKIPENVGVANKKPADNDAEANEKEADDQALPADNISLDSLTVNAYDESSVAELDDEKEILDEDENVSIAPSDDFLFVDNKPAKTAEQDTGVAEPDTRDETTAAPSDADQELSPLADSVRIVEDGQTLKFELSLNLKGFDEENISVRFVDNDLFIDAKKESTEDGSFSMHEVHRKYTIPETGILGSARAQVAGDGMVKVSVPLGAEEKAEQTVPETGILDSAHAQISGDGLVKVVVPLGAEEKVEPIEVAVVQVE